MKAIVLEVRNGVAAVLREDGVIVKTRQKCAVGDTSEIKVNKTWFQSGWTRAASAAAAVIILAGSGGFYGYNNVMACSYVSLDINPSVEYVLNRQNKVLKVTALNDDAEAVVEELNEQGIRNDTLEEALQKTEIILEEQEFMSSDELDYILVNVSTDSDTRKELLTKEANEALGMDEEKISLVVTDSSVEDRDKARKLGISAGRYGEMRAIEEPDGKPMEPDQTMVRKYQEAPVRDMLVNAGQIPEPPKAGAEGMQAPVTSGKSTSGQDLQAGNGEKGNTPGNAAVPSGSKENAPAEGAGQNDPGATQGSGQMQQPSVEQAAGTQPSGQEAPAEGGPSGQEGQTGGSPMGGQTGGSPMGGQTGGSPMGGGPGQGPR